VREGTRRMLVTALRAEVDEYIAADAGERDVSGKALVVRNGVARSQCDDRAGQLEVQAPQVNDRREDNRFRPTVARRAARRRPGAPARPSWMGSKSSAKTRGTRDRADQSTTIDNFPRG